MFHCMFISAFAKHNWNTRVVLIHIQRSLRAVPGKTASGGGGNGNQLKFGGCGVFPGI